MTGQGKPETPASASDVQLNLQEFLPYRLAVLAETVSQSLSQLYNARYGIAIPEWRVISILGQYGTTTAKQIGTHSRMHKTMVSRAVAALERKGLVERSANSDDMREAFVTLSARGRAVYAEITPAATDFADALLVANQSGLLPAASQPEPRPRVGPGVLRLAAGFVSILGAPDLAADAAQARQGLQRLPAL